MKLQTMGRIAIAPLFLFSISAANAQDGEAASDDSREIVVKGMSEKEIDAAVRGYVKGLTVTVSYDPLSRYQSGTYCPAVVGLGDNLGGEIANRMRKVAKAAGIAPAGAECRPSAIVFFVDDKQQFLTAFRKQHPVYFRDPKGELWSPPKSDGPVTAWQLTQELDAQGNPLSRDADGVRYVASPQGGSHLKSMISLVVAMSVVIIERKAAVGLSTVQLADYALMRTVTDRVPKSVQDVTAFSILGVIDAPMNSETHPSLTATDLAYLKARYSGDPMIYGERQAAMIRADVKKTLTGEGEKKAGDADPAAAQGPKL